MPKSPEGEYQPTQESPAEIIEHASPEKILKIFQKLDQSHAWLMKENHGYDDQVREIETMYGKHRVREFQPNVSYGQLEALNATAAAIQAIDSIKSFLFASVSDEVGATLVEKLKSNDSWDGVKKAQGQAFANGIERLSK